MNRWKSDIGYHVPKLTLLEIWPLNSFIGDKQNINVIDVGSNTGLWCQAFMNTFGEQIASYHAIEPLEGNLKIFKSRIDAGLVPFDSKAVLHQFCVGPHNGTVEIGFHNEVSTLASVVLDEVQVGNRLVRNEHKKKIRQVRLDSFCTSRNIDYVDLVKVDVEGYEWDVFEGATTLLKSQTVELILFEFGQHQGNLQQSFKQFWDLLSGYGYHIYRQAVGRNFFGLQYIASYDESLEEFDSMWMILASKQKHTESLNNPFVIGKYYPKK
ncbi:MAG: FkbM family methyltransferase [Phormidesmis sp.]